MAKRNPRLIDYGGNDFGTICVCAVRYALGRMTYMPTLVQNFIKPILPYICEKSLYVIIRDIKEFGGEEHDHKRYGWECDYNGWMLFLKQCEAEMERRKNGRPD